MFKKVLREMIDGYVVEEIIFEGEDGLQPCHLEEVPWLGDVLEPVGGRLQKLTEDGYYKAGITYIDGKLVGFITAGSFDYIIQDSFMNIGDSYILSYSK